MKKGRHSPGCNKSTNFSKGNPFHPGRHAYTGKALKIYAQVTGGESEFVEGFIKKMSNPNLVLCNEVDKQR